MSTSATHNGVEHWPWPDSLDAIVAAPRHHLVLVEDERVRVLRTTIPPGDVVPLHTHRWGGVAYVESCSHFVRRNERGDVLFDSRSAGELPIVPCAQWMQPLPPHTVENLGPMEIRILIVEFKDPATHGVSIQRKET